MRSTPQSDKFGFSLKRNRMSLFQCSEEESQRILDVYGKTQKTLQEDTENIQNWMKKQPHFPEITDERVIQRFLILHKFRIQDAKVTLDNYYSIRSLLPEFYNRNINDDDIKKTMNVMCYIPLPKLTKDLHRVVVVKPIGRNLDDFDGTAYIIQILNIVEVRLREDNCLSDIFICDLEGIKIDILLKFPPTLMRQAVLLTEKVYTTRPQGIHCVNAPSFLNSFLSFVKALVKPKLAERIHVHTDMGTLCQSLSKSILPKDYGGEEKSLAELNDLWKDKLLEYRDLFEDVRKVRVNEDFRIEKSLNTEICGIEGNFRKLEVD